MARRPFGHNDARHFEPNPVEQIEGRPELLEDARDHVATMDLPGTPELRHARFIKAAGLPHWCGARKVTALSIADGEPRHGEKRSDDHVATFKVRAPLADFGNVEARECPTEGCFSQNAVYRYSATHYIAGSMSVTCDECDHVYDSEEWG